MMTSRILQFADFQKYKNINIVKVRIIFPSYKRKIINYILKAKTRKNTFLVEANLKSDLK